MPDFPRLFEPLQIGNFTVRNRIVNTTHGTGHSEQRDLRYLQERARGGAALIGIHSAGTTNFPLGPGRWKEDHGRDFDVRLPNPATPEGIEFFDKIGIPGLRKRAEVIHDEGAKVFGQVYNAGAGMHRDSLQPAFGPSTVPEPFDAAVPHELTEEEIADLVTTFAHGIRRAKEAGLDAAEIHGAHGYLVTEFLSPRFNLREDRYGGSRENRVRFVLEIIEAGRKLVGPDYPIGIRIGLDGDGQHGGLTIDELAGIGQSLSPHVAFISVSGGNYTGLADGLEIAYVSPWYVRPAHNVEAAAAVKKLVDVPVFVTGKITDPAMANSILADGAADMVGMVRALIADPELPIKAKEGRPDDIRMCVGMDECHYIGHARKPVMCAVNPAAGREAEMEIVPTEVRKTVLVVGAGPAGMEAARAAALRGHQVYLGDREKALGGTVRILAQDPNRRNLADMIVFFQRELRQAKVELLLGDEIEADVVLEMAPDAVVVATGGRPYIPEFPGVESPNVITAIDLFSGAAVAGEKVIVVGGMDDHIGAPTAAEFLADQGKEVELISEQVDLSLGAEHPTRYLLFKRLLTKGVTISMMTRIQSFDAPGASLLQTFTRQERKVRGVDTVVLACGTRADDRLAKALRGKTKELVLIGDSLAPRRIMHAMLDGARAGRML